MGAAEDKNKDGKPQHGRKYREELNRRYQNRITIAKMGQDASKRGEFVKAIKNYNQYLKIISDSKETPIENLTPKHFEKNEQAEMMLMSHIFWDLVKIYDRSPKLKNELIKSINLFVTFTVNQPYQVLNSEMIRKYIKKGKAFNIPLFRSALKKIQVESKACFIATSCFGYESETTNRLRVFKSDLAKTHFGLLIINYYYRYSPNLVNFMEEFPVVGICVKNIIFKPALYIFSRFFSLNK